MPSPTSFVDQSFLPGAPHEVVRAGAGAGKTYALTHKVMDLAEQSLKERGRLPRLVVTTFTRKATEELRERLMLLALEEKPHLLDFVNSRSQLVVSTIHGVMDLFLKRHGTELGIDPSYKIAGTSEASKLARQVLRQVLFEATNEGGPSDLLESFPFNLLVRIVRRIDAIQSQNPEALPFQVLDFEQIFRARSKRLARDLREVSLRIREEATKDTWLKIADLFLEIETVLTVGEWAAQREHLLALNADIPVLRRNPKGNQPVSDSTMDLAKAVRAEVKELIDPLYDPKAWAIFSEHYRAIHEVALRFSEAFRRAKLEQGLLEIGDLELLAMSCARTHPAAVNSFWQEWDHWLIDEYQDTSPFQVELLRRLTGQRPTFVVGDPQQSIYLFRGARSEVFSEREKQTQLGGGRHHFLRVNRRSRPELLLFINDFFERFDPPFAAMEPFYAEGALKSPSQPLPVVAKIHIAPEAGGEKAAEESEEEAAPAPAEAEGREREMQALVQHVQGLLANGARPEEICILGRTNRTLTEAAELLSFYRIPVHVHAASGFYDRREIRDALSLLRFLVNPHDTFNLVEMLRSPWFRVPDRDLVDATRRRKADPKLSLWESLTQPTPEGLEFEAVRRMQGLLAATLKEGITETFRRALVEAGFIDFSHLHDVSGRREANLWKLLARLQQEETKPGFNPVEFVHLAMSELKLDEGNSEGDAVAAIEPNRVNLMTVHASKGLEFAHVCLPCMDQKPRTTSFEDFTFDERFQKWALRAPFGENHDMTKSLPEDEWLKEFRAQELREHARVLYVALTRSSQSLYLSWTGQPKSESWAEMAIEQGSLQLEEGRHEKEHYAYTVSRVEPELQPVSSESAIPTELRTLWQMKGVHEGEIDRSVSELLDAKSGAVEIKTGGELVRRLTSANRGTVVHRLVELLKYPSADQLEMLAERWFPKQRDQVLEAVAFVQSAQEPSLAELIANGEVEWGFSFFEPTERGGLIVEGQVDLWGRTNAGEVWIVDYKTGHPKDRDKAFDQMALYAHAIRRSGKVAPDEQIRLAAVYPFDKKIYTEKEPASRRVLDFLLAKQK